jgi:hypothetical protein
MKHFAKCLVLFLFVSSYSIATEQYIPNSGDKELDDLLLLIHKNINRKTKSKLSQFVDNIAEKFQVPVEKVEELFNHYEFKAPDVLLSVSIADVSGEPLQNVSAVYFKNKQKGWRYTLRQLNITRESKVFTQIKKDMNVKY